MSITLGQKKGEIGMKIMETHILVQKSRHPTGQTMKNERKKTAGFVGVELPGDAQALEAADEKWYNSWGLCLLIILGLSFSWPYMEASFTH